MLGAASGPKVRTTPPMRVPAQEDTLVARARGGDGQAFDQIVRDHFARVHTFLHRCLQNRADADDLAQETFVRAHAALGTYRGEASLATWLRSIALRLAQDHRRSQLAERSALPLDEGVADAAAAAPERRSEQGELGRGVRAALDALPERLRTPLVLRVLDGREYDEIAALTGVRPATARSQVVEARRALLRALAPFLEPDRPERKVPSP